MNQYAKDGAGKAMAATIDGLQGVVCCHDAMPLGHVNRLATGVLNKALWISSVLEGRLRCIAALLLLLSVCQPGRADQLAYAAATAGSKTYLSTCAACHGAGEGMPGFAPDLSRFKGDQAAFLSVVTNGRPGTTMPRWQGVITEQEMLSIWAYLKQKSSSDKNEKANDYAFQEKLSEIR